MPHDNHNAVLGGGTLGFCFAAGAAITAGENGAGLGLCLLLGTAVFCIAALLVYAAIGALSKDDG